ncbi:ribonuclease P protein component 3 [Methanolobus psychrotolerans]|uniref:ribonuclease P protein component 3 n=1 Tax=Methanolobus psychrotolerans TaxID=1874706 RepID=UPI000B91597D|nr:ribonuclease P protein component 3 [Methanolobus psychrotolerans]
MVKPKFYDLNVYSVPEGKNTVEELAALAKHFGYRGIAITNPSNSCPPGKPTVADGIDIFSGVELKVENASKLHGLIGKYRKIVDVIIVYGGSESVNRAAVENSNVDVLSNFGSLKDSGLNHVLAKSAHENDVAVSFDLGEIISQHGGRRIRALSNFKKDLKLVRKYDVPFLLTGNVRSCYDLRAPYELMALAELFGMTREEAMSGLSTTAEQIISKNRPSANYVSSGVEIVSVPSNDAGIFLEEGDGQ